MALFVALQLQAASEFSIMGDDPDFRQQFADVTPLEQDKADIDKKTAVVGDYSQRRQAALASSGTAVGISDPLELLTPAELLAFARPGLQHQLMKKLRLGKFVSQASLDLHGMTVEQARTALWRFVEDCIQQQLRVVIVVHGKSERRVGGKAILKSHVAHWLAQMPAVLAFCSAQPAHGGSGALYLMLKKSAAVAQPDDELPGD